MGTLTRFFAVLVVANTIGVSGERTQIVEKT